jgi:hypothetical protein
MLVTDSLFHPGMKWPPGLRLAGPEHLAEYGVRPSSPHIPASAWRLVEDDGADPGLDGRRVELTLNYADGVPEIAERSEVT